jgi:uncharacterized protein (TIGR03067 family)
MSTPFIHVQEINLPRFDAQRQREGRGIVLGGRENRPVTASVGTFLVSQTSRGGQIVLNMKTNLILAAVFALALLFCGGCASTANPPKHDLAKLQGTWIGHEVDGPPGECRMTISGDSLKAQAAGQDESYAAKLILAPGASPKQADLLIADCSAPQYIHKTAKMIYKIEGKTLTIAGHEPGDETAPTGFERDGQSRVFVFTRQ